MSLLFFSILFLYNIHYNYGKIIYSGKIVQVCESSMLHSIPLKNSKIGDHFFRDIKTWENYENYMPMFNSYMIEYRDNVEFEFGYDSITNEWGEYAFPGSNTKNKLEAVHKLYNDFEIEYIKRNFDNILDLNKLSDIIRKTKDRHQRKGYLPFLYYFVSNAVFEQIMKTLFNKGLTPQNQTELREFIMKTVVKYFRSFTIYNDITQLINAVILATRNDCDDYLRPKLNYLTIDPSLITLEINSLSLENKSYKPIVDYLRINGTIIVQTMLLNDNKNNNSMI